MKIINLQSKKKMQISEMSLTSCCICVSVYWWGIVCGPMAVKITKLLGSDVLLDWWSLRVISVSGSGPFPFSI